MRSLIWIVGAVLVVGLVGVAYFLGTQQGEKSPAPAARVQATQQAATPPGHPPAGPQQAPSAPSNGRYTHYRVDPDRIEIRRGVVWRSVMQVPRSRVQHTDVNRGPIDRSYGLATLVIFTAGTEHASVSLSGLAEADAYTIRDHLIAEGGGGDAV